jgi:hypothetical protein
MRLLLAVLFVSLSVTSVQARLSLRGELEDIGAFYAVQDVGENRGRLQLGLSFLPESFFLVRAGACGEFLTRSGKREGIATNLRPAESYAEIRGGRFDLRMGYIDVIWGVLDEVQPTDVVNPLDVSRFFLENRARARLPIPAAALRIYLPGRTRLELVAVPFFEPGVFDQLDEATSPFNFYRWLVPASVPLRRRTPPRTLDQMEYGARLTTTHRRTDISLCFFRGREDFPIYVEEVPEFAGGGGPEFSLIGTYPWFTMVGGDLETVAGGWGFRAEGALFLEDSFQDLRGEVVVEGKSFQCGAGIDREVNDYVIVGEIVVQARWAPLDFAERREELGFIGGLERRFHFGREKVESFLIYNPLDNTLFARAGVGIRPLPGFWLELTGGLFAGSGSDLVGRFDRADFVSLSGRYRF